MNFYSYAPRDGMSYHPTKELAIEAAELSSRTACRQNADPREIEMITWGEVRSRAILDETGAFATLRNQLLLDYEEKYPQVIDGKMLDAQGNLILLKNIHETDLMYHDLVLGIAGYWLALHGKITRFKQNNFEDVTSALDLLFEKYKVKRGGKDGNMQFFTHDRKYKLLIAIQKNIDFAPELQVAEKKMQDALNQMTTEENSDLKTIVAGAFNLDSGKVRVAEILRLRSYKISNPLWNEAMEVINKAITVISSKKQIRLYERNATGEYINIPLDIAAL